MKQNKKKKNFVVVVAFNDKFVRKRKTSYHIFIIRKIIDFQQDNSCYYRENRLINQTVSSQVNFIHQVITLSLCIKPNMCSSSEKIARHKLIWILYHKITRHLE